MPTYYDPNKLNALIERLDPHKKPLAKRIRDTILAQNNEERAAHLLHKTYEFLSAPKKNHRHYRAESRSAQGHPETIWELLGVILILLNLCIISFAIFCTTPPALMALTSSGLLAGFGLFHYGNTPTGLSRDMIELTELCYQHR